MYFPVILTYCSHKTELILSKAKFKNMERVMTKLKEVTSGV